MRNYIPLKKGGGAIITFKNKRAFKNQNKNIFKDIPDDVEDIPIMEKQMTVEELKKPIRAKGKMDSTIAKLDKLKVKGLGAPVVKKKRKPIVLDL